MNHQLIAHLREQYKIAVLDIPNQVTKQATKHMETFCDQCDEQYKKNEFEYVQKYVTSDLNQQLRFDKVRVWAIEYLRNHPAIGFSFTKAKIMLHVNYFQLYYLNMSAEEYWNYVF